MWTFRVSSGNHRAGLSLRLSPVGEIFPSNSPHRLPVFTGAIKKQSHPLPHASVLLPMQVLVLTITWPEAKRQTPPDARRFILHPLGDLPNTIGFATVDNVLLTSLCYAEFGVRHAD